MRKFLLPVLLALLSPTSHAGDLRTLDAVNVEGSYSPASLLKNAQLERNIVNVTASAGTFAAVTTAANVGRGSRGASWDASASTQTLTFEARAIPAGLYGRNGVASILIKAASGTATHVLEAHDGTNVLASATVQSSTSAFQRTTVNFPFPSSGTVTLRLKASADEPLIYVDDAFLGDAGTFNLGNITNVTSTQDISSLLTFTGLGTVTNVKIWMQRVGDRARIFGSLTQGSTTSTTASVDLPSTMLVDYAKHSTETKGKSVGLAIRGEEGSAVNFWSNDRVAVLFTDGATTNKIFMARSQTTTGFTKSLGDATGLGTGGNISIDFDIPITGWSAEQAFRPDQSSASWSGYYNTTCTWTANHSGSFSEVAANAGCGSLNTRQNVNFGTVSAYGATKPGITFSPPKAGKYFVCMSFTWYGGNYLNNWQIQDLSGNVVTTASGYASTSGSSLQAGACGIYNAASTASTTLRLMEVGGGTGTIDVAANTPFEWSIFQIDAPQAAPLLVGSITSNSSGVERMERARIANNGSVSITSQSGSWLSSVSRPSTGLVTANFAAGTFSATPTCVCAADDTAGVGSGIVCAAFTAISSSAYTFRSINGALGVADTPINIICMGPK